MNFTKVFLNNKLTGRISGGHNWVFSSEVGDVEGQLDSKEIVHVYSSKGSFIGKGFCDASSIISVRMLTRLQEEVINEGWLLNKFKNKIKQSESLHYNINCCRFINGDTDGLSGLHIDKIKNTIWVECLTKAWDYHFIWVDNCLKKVFPECNIIKDDANHIRALEGLKVTAPIRCNQFSIEINNTTFSITHPSDLSIEKQNIRQMVSEYSFGKTVWDLCCGNGNLALTANSNGAKKVVAIDNDPNCLLAKTLERTSQDRLEFIQENVFDFLKTSPKDIPDFIILDMPVFNLKTPKKLEPYMHLTMKCMKLLNNNDLLLIGNSSSKIEEYQFLKMISEAASDAKCYFTICAKIPQPIDFPIMPIYSHTDFLHFYLLQIIKQ